MMKARAILIRTLDCLSEEKFVSKNQALYTNQRSTCDKVKSSFDIHPEISTGEEELYGARADDILQWINAYTGDNDFLANCKRSVEIADSTPEQAYGMLTALPEAYLKHLESIKGLDKVTKLNSFLGDPGTRADYQGEVISIQKFSTFIKVNTVSDCGHLVSYGVNYGTKNQENLPPVGSRVHVKAGVYKNKFTNPFETTLSKVTIKVI